jgi:hypothetical protein
MDARGPIGKNAVELGPADAAATAASACTGESVSALRHRELVLMRREAQT